MKSFISEQLFRQFSRSSVLSPAPSNCIGITGQPLDIAGVVHLELSFPGGNLHSYPGKFLVSPSLCQPLKCVLGWDFLTSNGLQLSFLGNCTYCLEGTHGSTPLCPIPWLGPPSADTKSTGNDTSNVEPASNCLMVQSTTRGPVFVSLETNLCIPGRTEVLVHGIIPKSSREQLGMITPKLDSDLACSILAAYTVCQAEGRKVPVRLMNTSNVDLELHAGQKVGLFCPLIESYSDCKMTAAPKLAKMNINCSTSDNAALASHLAANINSSLNDQDKNALLQTLLQYSDVFDDSLGHSDVIQHRIDTGSSSPIRQYPRRLPYAYRNETKAQVEGMLQQGVIQPSSSPWASPIVLVKKKDGTFRFCVDYRKLNSVTKKDAHPLPRVDDLLDALAGSKYFSTLDLRAGYWQLSVAPEDREKTAFVTPDGLWEFIRLPFGVSGGPATFQRAIEIILSGLTYHTCLCYFDDIIIPSDSIQQQCERLSIVLSRFQKHNLRVKASKCCFGASKVPFLGHVVSEKGVHTDPRKIEAVSNLPPPTNLDQVRSFLGLAGYYRRFIPNFSHISSPLVKLTKKGSKFSWTEEQEHSFSQLKQLLCTAPVLSYPHFDKCFVLQTDASDMGVGAVLTQYDSSGQEHVISYASRSLSNREKAYSTTEKEALAVVFATDHFRAYLLGRQFTLITDHSALCWLNSLEPKGRLGRWVMALQEYSFDVQHRAGISNGNADALSRLPAPFPVDNRGCHSSISSPSCVTSVTPESSLQQEQLNDPDLSKVIEFKSHQMPRPPFFVWAHNPTLRALWHCWDTLHLVNGILVKGVQGQPTSLSEYAFVIPFRMIDSVLQGIHCSPFSGHLGLKRTLQRARGKFFWPKMSLHITDFVRSCQSCAQNKLGAPPSKAPLQPIDVNEPFVFWAMDYMGPLPETTQGNKHLLVIMDHFTKWCEAFPTKDQRASTVADILVTRVFSRFGPPTIIHSDQGRNFESNLMHEICQLMGVHKSRTTAYHPQCDGLVERQNRTLQEILSSFVSQHKDDWDNWVSLAVYAYNTSCHESTGFSPYELVFGRDPRTPLALDLDIPLKNPSSQSDYSRSVRSAVHNIKVAAQNKLAASRFKQASSYDSNCRNWAPIPSGSSVWLRRPKTWKFGGKWVGPYEVLSRNGVTYKLRSKEGKEIVAHHNNLKECAIPANKGVPYCPVPENPDINIVVEGPPAPQGRAREQPEIPHCRPLRLRQNIHPPLRFGDFVSH